MSKINENKKHKCNINGTGISSKIMKCKPYINDQTTIIYNPETKEVFDKLENFLGYGVYDEESKILIIKNNH